ncbi:hypothetical protein [Actinokineospora bangkokensis]|uniref:Uncharacterized protein n=1 Tax=Actinokineospora bangkokensis TaxID=1193682 RepID=A0A1Q9LN75_9PSEU|nr:hypothetical protein [Actinokineospora bangkokensis]OLR93453.1 hypothetical protein BJP25_14180 [Actinokineospora bangkokensis]
MALLDVDPEPGSALSDPDTRELVARRVVDREWGALERRSWVVEQSYNPEAIVNVLAHHPWRELRYKYGRWYHDLVFAELSGLLPWRQWALRKKTLLLLDADGDEVGEFGGLKIPVAGAEGTLLFAGDPAYAGVISAVGEDGERDVVLVGNVRLGHPDLPVTIGERARDVARTLRPGRDVDVVLHDVPEAEAAHFGPWVVDHPKRPPKPAKRRRGANQ